MTELLDRLKDKALLKTQSFINGAWVEGKPWIEVTSPSNRSVLAQMSDVGAKGAEDAIDAAAEAFKTWKNTSVFERAALVKKWHDLILEHADDLGHLITAEMGKPFPEARGEVVYGAGFVDWSAEEAKRSHCVKGQPCDWSNPWT